MQSINYTYLLFINIFNVQIIVINNEPRVNYPATCGKRVRAIIVFVWCGRVHFKMLQGMTLLSY